VEDFETSRQVSTDPLLLWETTEELVTVVEEKEKEMVYGRGWEVIFDVKRLATQDLC
jgi:hypothetical protein